VEADKPGGFAMPEEDDDRERNAGESERDGADPGPSDANDLKPE
jgi:hypothetical protein